MVLAYDLLEDRFTIDVIFTKFFPSAVLKWQKVLRIRIIFYVTGQKIGTKKSCRDISRFENYRSQKNHNFLLRTVTNEIASICTENRLRQMAFFLFAKVGKGEAKAGFRVMLKYFEIKKGFSLSYKTNRFHVAVSLFSNRPQKTSKCGKNISYTLGYAP